MFADLKYKTKVYLLLSAWVLGFIIIYHIAIKETLALHARIAVNEAKINELANAPQELMKWQNKLDATSTDMNFINGKKDNFREQLLENTTEYCKKLGITLCEFPQAHTYTETSYSVRTYTILVEGTFLKLQELVYILETGFGKGRIPSIHYFIKNDFKSGKKSLWLKIYIQYIIKNEKHEEEFSNK